jgi:two-component system cell cycle response regulator DivK
MRSNAVDGPNGADAPEGRPAPAPARRRLHDWVSFAEARELLGGVSVLVFDADTEASGRIFISLGQVGASVRLARRTVQGLRMLEELQPGIVIVATAMPDTDAIALVRQLGAWAEPRGARILAIGARNHRSERRRFLAAACDGFLTKPVDVRLFAQELARELVAPAV